MKYNMITNVHFFLRISLFVITVIVLMVVLTLYDSEIQNAIDELHHVTNESLSSREHYHIRVKRDSYSPAMRMENAEGDNSESFLDNLYQTEFMYSGTRLQANTCIDRIFNTSNTLTEGFDNTKREVFANVLQRVVFGNSLATLYEDSGNGYFCANSFTQSSWVSITIQNQCAIILDAWINNEVFEITANITDISTLQGFESFIIKKPSFLPDNTFLNSANLEVFENQVFSVVFEYQNKEGYSWNPGGQSGFITLLQSYVGLEAYLDVKVSYPQEIKSITLGNVDALFINSNYLTGHASRDAFWSGAFSAHLIWIENGVYFNLFASALPISVINEDIFFEVALSLMQL